MSIINSLVKEDTIYPFTYKDKDDEFEVSLCYFNSEDNRKLVENCIDKNFNVLTQQDEGKLDEEKYTTEYTKAVLKGWKGLKYKHLAGLGIPHPVYTEEKLEEEIEYSIEEGEALMKRSSKFYQFVSNHMRDFTQFAEKQRAEAAKNLSSSQKTPSKEGDTTPGKST